MQQTWAHTLGLIASFVLTQTALAQGARAQTAEGVGTNASDQNYAQLQEVVVTAQKRAEDLQTVPLAVSALSQVQLEATNARDFADYVRFLPGVSFNSLDQSSRGTFLPVVRGVQLPGASASAPTTGFYLGEVPVTGIDTLRNGVPNANTFDLERVEVLRGPQGTLYGASAMGGVIKVVPNSPNVGKYQGEIRGEANGMSSGGPGDRVDGMINVPIVAEHVAFRVTAYQEHDSGFIDGLPLSNLLPGTTTFGGQRDRDRNDADQWGARAAVKAVYDDFSAQLSIQHQLVREGSSPRISDVALNYFGPHDPTTFAVAHEPESFNFTLGSLELKYDLHWGELESITGLYHSNSRYTFQETGFNVALLGPSASESSNLLRNFEAEHATTEELRLSTKFAAPVNFLAGVFYSHNSQDLSQYLIDPIYIPVFGTPDLFSQHGTTSKIDQKAVFANVTWKVVPSLELQAGARYFHYSTASFQELDGVFGGGATYNLHFAQSGAIPSFTASYTLAQDVLLFLHAAKGFRPGYDAGTVVYPDTCDAELRALGYTGNSITQTIRSDTLWNYEGGVKTEWLDHRLRINATGYSIDWSELPASVNLQCGFAVASNLGRARINGAELETAATPSPDWLVQLSGTFTDAVLKSGGSAVGGMNGERLPITPKFAGSAAVEYHHPVGASVLPSLTGFQGFVRGDVTATGPSFWQFDHSVPGGRRPELTLVNFRAGLRSDTWEFALFTRNAFDQVRSGYCAPGFQSSVPPPDFTTCINEPRTFGASVDRRF